MEDALKAARLTHRVYVSLFLAYAVLFSTELRTESYSSVLPALEAMSAFDLPENRILEDALDDHYTVLDMGIKECQLLLVSAKHEAAVTREPVPESVRDDLRYAERSMAQYTHALSDLVGVLANTGTDRTLYRMLPRQALLFCRAQADNPRPSIPVLGMSVDSQIAAIGIPIALIFGSLLLLAHIRRLSKCTLRIATESRSFGWVVLYPDTLSRCLTCLSTVGPALGVALGLGFRGSGLPSVRAMDVVAAVAAVGLLLASVQCYRSAHVLNRKYNMLLSGDGGT